MGFNHVRPTISLGRNKDEAFAMRRYQCIPPLLNLVKATMDGLAQLRTKDDMAQLREVEITD